MGGYFTGCSAEGQDLCHSVSRRTPFIRPPLALCLPAGSVSRSAVGLPSKEMKKEEGAQFLIPPDWPLFFLLAFNQRLKVQCVEFGLMGVFLY